MNAPIEIDGIEIGVIKKRIRNIHLRVHAPDGRVSISAPSRMSHEAIRTFVVSKRDWIHKHRQRIRDRRSAYESAASFEDGDALFHWGQRSVLSVTSTNASPSVMSTDGEITLCVPSGSTAARRAAVLNAWYRREVELAAPALIAQWEPIIGVKANSLCVRKMKSRWGSCNTRTHRICLNSELAKRPRDVLEYVVVHELTHLLEPSHNRRFYALMDRFMPEWKEIRRRNI